MKYKITISLGICALLAILQAPVNAADKVFLQTNSNGFKVNWSEKDLSATAGGVEIFSAKKIAFAERPKKSSKTTVDRSIRLLSLVGPVLSYQDEQTLDWPGMAHPGVGDVRLYHAVDLRHPGRKASLKDYFAPEEILLALKNNPLLKPACKAAQNTNLDALVRRLSDTDVMVKNDEGEQVKLMVNQDLLSQFAFDKVNGNTVSVSLSLYSQADNEIKSLNLNLPVKNADLALWLKAAESAKAGILGHALSAKNQDSETDFHFGP